MSQTDTENGVPAVEDIRVMVVDDNIEAATTLAYLLQLMGCRTAVAYDGLNAVRIACLFKPHLSLVDYEMPGLDGCATVQLLREQEAPERHMAVCFTGRGDPEDEQRCRDAGFDALIIKPMEAQALSHLLGKCKEQRALGKEGA